MIKRASRLVAVVASLAVVGAQATEMHSQLVIDNHSNCSLHLLEQFSERNAVWSPPRVVYAHRSAGFAGVIDVQEETVFEGVRASASYQVQCGHLLRGNVNLSVYGQKNLLIGVDVSPGVPLQSAAEQEFIAWVNDGVSRIVLTDGEGEAVR